MRRVLILTSIVFLTVLPLAISGRLLHGYAQIVTPQSDEFQFDSSTAFSAPFTVQCAALAVPPCPDTQGAGTWSLNQPPPVGRSGYLRIVTQVGSLEGTAAQSSNNARNLVLQHYSSDADWTATTSLTFPGATMMRVGQTAGMLVYQNDDNFIFLARVFDSATPKLVFLQEINGVDVLATVNESGAEFPTFPVYLRIQKVGTLYKAWYSYDNIAFTPIGPGTPPTPVPTSTSVPPTATSTPVTPLPTATPTATPTVTPIPTLTPTVTGTPPTPPPTETPTATATTFVPPNGYIASYATPQVGVFAYGGTNSAAAQNLLPADFQWFRVGNSNITPTPATSTPLATATSTPVTPTPTNTSVPPTNTPTSVPPTETPTNTEVPTPAKKYHLRFKYLSIWFHFVRQCTWNHVEVQANHKQKDGIWAHVYFPNGKHLDYFENTDKKGHWKKTFGVPCRSAVGKHHDVLVTAQLWHGKYTAKSFGHFHLV